VVRSVGILVQPVMQAGRNGEPLQQQQQQSEPTGEDRSRHLTHRAEEGRFHLQTFCN
jgi:hypothetical protein